MKELGISKPWTDFTPTKSAEKTSNTYARGFNYKSNLEVDVVSEKDTKYTYRPIKQVETGPTKYEKFIQSQNKEKKDYKIGQVVLHPKFGIGKVFKISGEFIDVNFDKLGVKTLLKEIAPLKAL